jgi:metal-sulfur cluster biosynthetic enzyme
MMGDRLARIDAVRAALATVTDPELDESVVELGFITGIDVQGNAVNVKFRLPTYWCAANFSYLMASDMRDAIRALPWAGQVSVVLDEHMFVEAINDGVAAGADFGDAFPAEAGGDLSALRLNFGLKSYERRQEALLRHLLGLGHEPGVILGLSVAGLKRLTLDEDGKSLRARYLARRGLVGGMPAAFVDRDGAAIGQETFGIYLRNLRRVGLNAEFNGALCRGLLAARYGDAPAVLPAEPELIDFIRIGAAPAQ